VDSGVTFPVPPGQRILDRRRQLRADIVVLLIGPADLLDWRFG
jgi:hypothetical protein